MTDQRRNWLRRLGLRPAATSRAVLGMWMLACATAAAESEVPPPMDLPAPESTTAAEADLTPSILLDDLESTARAKQAGMERLRQQLLQLREANRRAAEASRNAVVPEPPPADTIPPHDVHTTPVPPEEGVGHSPDEPGDQHHDRADDQATEAPDGDHGAPTTGEHPGQAVEAVTGTRINRLALADSLFATGQADLALQAYNSIELSRLAAVDRYWIEYQIANCHRRLGDRAEAEQRYRKLAGLVDGGWCAAHARWWLDALATRTALERDLGEIRLSLKTIEEQLNAQPAE